MPRTGTRLPTLAPAARPDVGLHDPPAGAASRQPDELDAELLRQLPHGGSRADRRRRVGRDDRDERLGGLARRLVTGLDGAQELLALLADHDQHRTDGRDVPLLDEDLEHGPGARRRDLDGRLVGLDLDERLILLDVVALGDEPAGDLRLGEALAEIGQLELVRHGGAGYCDVPVSARRRLAQNASTRRTASMTRSTEGMYQSSSCQYGYGTS